MFAMRFFFNAEHIGKESVRGGTGGGKGRSSIRINKLERVNTELRTTTKPVFLTPDQPCSGQYAQRAMKRGNYNNPMPLRMNTEGYTTTTPCLE